MKYVFNAQKLAVNGNNAKDGMKTFLKKNELDVIASLKASAKTDLGISPTATGLTQVQIQTIVDKIVEVK